MTRNSGNAQVCVVVGVGPGNGAALVRRFASKGYATAMLARSEGVTRKLEQELPLASAYIADAANALQLQAALEKVAADLGPVDVLIYNAGKGVWGSVEEVSIEEFEEAWRLNTLGAFAAARAVIPSMKAKGAGQIVFIGATASRRGGAKTAAFAAAKASQRSLAQSLARALGPCGIHVSLVIVDGIVDEPKMRAQLADKPDDFFLSPDDVADTAFMLTQQKPSAWTFELDLRPYGESW